MFGDDVDFYLAADEPAVSAVIAIQLISPSNTLRSLRFSAASH